MPVSMIEYIKDFEPGTTERAFIETFARESDIMGAVPIKPVTGGKHTYFRTARLPTVAFRALNGNANESTGNITKHEEGVSFMDERVQVDRAIVDNFGESHRAKQVQLKATAMSQEWTRTFIKGDNASTNGIEPDGLQRRCVETNITRFQNSAASGGAALSLSNLDLVINAVRRRTHIIAPYSMKFRLDAALRNTSITGFNTAPDPMDAGRAMMTYKGLPILWGYEPDDSPLPLNFDEVADGGGGAVCTSIYVVNFGEDGVTGIEGTRLKIEDEGRLPGTPNLSHYVKWDFGFAIEHPRAAARLTSISNAAIVF
ncbi:MAG: major capsid protein [Aestuariivirga sp.]